jgi:predicted outer membrane repeat protein
MQKYVLGLIILSFILSSCQLVDNKLYGFFGDGATAVSFTVDSALDVSDSDTSDGVCDDGGGNCTLRAAIEQGDALSVPVNITIPTMTITLTTAAQLVRILNASPMTITGNGVGNTIIEQFPGATDRIMINGRTTTIDGVTIRNGNNGNGAIFFGGGAINTSGALTLKNCTFDNNTAGPGANRGGAIYSNNSLTVENCIFSNNTSVNDGGAIYHFSVDQLRVDQSTFDTNAGVRGQAIYTISLDSIIENSTFANHTGQTVYHWVSGGPNDNGIVRNSTFDNNQHGVIFRGQFGFPARMGFVFNSTFNNTFRGLQVEDGAGVEVANTIFAIAGQPDCTLNTGGTVTSLGYNIENGSNGCGLGAVGDLPNTDPLLNIAGLQANGGPTDTILLQGGSPARDVIPPGSCLMAEDQRGVVRPQGGNCDMGATEQ